MKNTSFFSLVFFLLIFYKASSCTFTISLCDSWGDGWNGNSVTVTVNGVAALTNVTITSGYGQNCHFMSTTGNFSFDASDGDVVVVTYNATGSDMSENYYTVYNTLNQIVVQSGQFGAIPSNTTFTAICPGPTCTDGIWNGDEEYTDCGGSNCPPCPQCANGVQDADEDGVDCGGLNCSPCITDLNIDDVNGLTLYTCEGNLYDSGGANGQYGNSESYTVTFCSTNGSPLIANVFYSGEACCDHLYIYDGTTTGSPQLANIVGSANQLYLASGSCLTFRFTSDGSEVGDGFAISFSCGMNSDPCNAWLLPTSLNCLFSQVTNLGAGDSGIVPPCGNYNGGDVWFEVTVPGTGMVTVNTGNLELDDAAMALYSGPNCSDLSLISCDENSSGNGDMPWISASNLVPGSSVWIQVWDEGGDTQGTFDICVMNNNGPPSCDPSSPPANDDCLFATPICSFNGFCGNTSNTYTSSQIPVGFCGSVENNSWLSFVAAETQVMLNVWSSNCLNSQGIQMEIYHTNDCSNFTSVSNCYSNPSNYDFTISTDVPLTIGETYYLMIDGFDGDNCDFVIQALEGVLITTAICLETGTDSVTICSGEQTQLLATGGTGYIWTPATGLDDPNSASPIASPTSTTTYTVSVTGGNPDCPGSDVDSVIVYVSGFINASLSSTPAACGACNGTATVESVTGQTPFTYLWDDSQATQTAVGLCEGTIYLTISDANGCVIEEFVDVGNTGSVVADFTVNSVAQCLNGNSFSFTNTGSNTGVETYLWNFGDGSTAVTQNASHSYASDGVYTVTQTVSYAGCVDVFTMDIEVFEHPTITFSPFDANCFGVCDGEITVNPAGGLPPYSDLWSNGQLTATATSLCPGTYNVTVTDALGCTASASQIINEPAAMTLFMFSVDASCGGSDGEASVVVDGGTPGYSYSWSSGGNSDTEAGISAGLILLQ